MWLLWHPAHENFIFIAFRLSIRIMLAHEINIRRIFWNLFRSLTHSHSAPAIISPIGQEKMINVYLVTLFFDFTNLLPFILEVAVS